MEDWLFKRAPGIEVQVLALVLICTSAFCYLGLVRYVIGSTAFFAACAVVFNTRWKGDPDPLRKAQYISVAWPLSALLLPRIIWREERARKLRIIREVLET